MKRAMKITKKCLMKEKMKVRFCLSLIFNAYVWLLCGQNLRLLFYLSVELLIYAAFMLTNKKGKENMTNSVSKINDKGMCILVLFL